MAMPSKDIVACIEASYTIDGSVLTHYIKSWFTNPVFSSVAYM